MLDLQKYLKRAEADPGFKEKLLQDANQAIKEKFGDELPYKLKCKEKLSFEVEAIESLLDADASSVAGGSNPDSDIIIPDLSTPSETPVINPPGLRITKGKTVLRRGKDGKYVRVRNDAPSPTLPSPQPSNNGTLSNDALSGVAGGSPGLNPTLIPFDEDLFFNAPHENMYNVTFRMPSLAPGSMGSIAYTDVIEPGPDALSLPNRLGARHSFKLVRGQDGNIYIIQ